MRSIELWDVCPSKVMINGFMSFKQFRMLSMYPRKDCAFCHPLIVCENTYFAPSAVIKNQIMKHHLKNIYILTNTFIRNFCHVRELALENYLRRQYRSISHESMGHSQIFFWISTLNLINTFRTFFCCHM